MEHITPNHLLLASFIFLGIVAIVHFKLGKKYTKEDKVIIEKHEEHFSVDADGVLHEPKYYKHFS